MLHIFIGYDAREDIAYRVAAHSAKRHCSVPCVITPLKLDSLKAAGMYWRKHRIENNQKVDEVDGKPFSTDFSFSRFLVPHICRRHGITQALFMDCDFLFYEDPMKMMNLIDPTVAVSVVKHRFTPKESVKMDGVAQTQYARKLWSSLMVFNISHPDCNTLTPEVVNSSTGSYLHGFEWTNAIGEIDETWNWLPYHSPTTRYAYENPKAVHYTEGGPWFPLYKDVPFGSAWEAEKRLVTHEYDKWSQTLDIFK